MNGGLLKIQEGAFTEQSLPRWTGASFVHFRIILWLSQHLRDPIMALWRYS